VIDTPRTMRILGKDGSEKYVRVNSFDPVTGQVINDLSQGKMDVVVTQSPSYATQRQEAAETYTNMVQANPQLGLVAGDLIMKSMDLPYADAISERLKMTLPPQILQAMQGDKAQDPMVVAAMAQADQAMQQVQLQGQAVQEAATQAQGEKSQADKAKADVQVAIANLKVQEAQLATDVANFKTLVAETQLKMAGEQNMNQNASELDGLRNEIGQALVQIQDQASQMMQGYAQQMAQIVGGMQAPSVVIPPAAPRPKIVRIDKVNGAYVPTYEQPQPDAGQTVQ
jgi:hypothetical protein